MLQSPGPMIPKSNKCAPSILELLRDRLATGSRRGNRSDPYHIAVVIECGGMRGVVAGGFIQVLCGRGISHAVDSVHGSSAGACAGAYFLANQPTQGSDIYYRDICNRDVVNRWRVLSRPCMVDTDFIVDEIIAKRRALEHGTIISQPGLFNVVTTTALDGKAIVHKNFETRFELLLALKASLRVPGLREPGVEIGGKSHLDGGLVAPIPIFSAIDSGATHILVLATQRETDYQRSRYLVTLEAAALGCLYGAAFATEYFQANQKSPWLELKASSHSIRYDILMRERNATHCAWHTIDMHTLRDAEAEAISAAEAYLSGDK